MPDIPVFNKDPNETCKIRPIQWASLLGSATISASSWTVASGLTRVSEHRDGTLTTVMVSGGTLEETYRCTNTITTSDGQTLEQSVDVYITEK